MYINKFIENVNKYQNEYAVICKNDAITYKELDERSSVLAEKILALFPDKEIIPIYVDRSIDMVVYILAIWKCRKAYILLDPLWERARINEYIGIIDTDFLIAAKPYDSIEGINVNIINIEKVSVPSQKTEDLRIGNYNNAERDLAYIFFTSGSTGKPKAAAIEQIGMLNHMLAKIHDIGLEQGDRLAQTANIGFNILNWQVFAPLYVGGTTIIYGKDIMENPGKLMEKIRTDAIAYIQITPSYLDVLNSCMTEKKDKFSSLKMLLLTGESLKSSQVNDVLENNTGLSILNSYGCTEVSDDSLHKIYTEMITDDLVTVGKPIPHTYVYVVKEESIDTKPVLCNKNEVGLIWLAGDIPVGRGYINNDVENKNFFGKDPFSGERLFKINDLGYFTDDGELVCLGRRDSQVKINGTRLNISEIENKILERAKDIKQVSVKAWKNDAGNTYLVGYIVADRKYGIRELRGFNGILKDIPQIMVPTFWIQLDKMPMLDSGKIDKKNLPRPVTTDNQEGNVHKIIRNNIVFPEQEEEKMIAQLWGEVLQYKQVGIEANNIDVNECFFNLGGDSLAAMRLASLLKERGYELDIQAFGKASAISERANYLRKIKN